MKIVMLPSRPNDIELTMALTMTLGQWKDLAEQCADHYPGWKLSSVIRRMVDGVTKQVEEQISDTD